MTVAEAKAMGDDRSSTSHPPVIIPSTYHYRIYECSSLNLISMPTTVPGVALSTATGLRRDVLAVPHSIRVRDISL